MVGFETADDAAVYRLDDDTALLLTVDFFTPIVDDPYDFGRITAANALSDIYAMGGRPLTALNLLAFPCTLGPDIVAEVLRGGADVCRSAGAIVVGGHTIDDKEPKFGLSVLGVARPDAIVRNAGALPGDVLVLTKPIGTGIFGTALKNGIETEESARAVIESMAGLNRVAAECMVATGVNAATDVTGFGLVGHLHEMLLASGCAATLTFADVPLFEGALAHAVAGVVPGRTADVIEYARAFTSWPAHPAPAESADLESGFATAEEDLGLWRVLCDPQTSGGLLISVPAERAEGLIDDIRSRGGSAARIGQVIEGEAGHVAVE
jgi:selenide, water dikinase